MSDGRRVGNASKQVVDDSNGPWMQWKGLSRHARAIKFIETYCYLPKGHGHGELLKLALFQKEWLEEVFAPGIRAAVMQIARGNGKSTFLAALATWAVFDPDDSGAPQVPVVATTVSQAIRSVYGVASSMVSRNYELANRAKIYTAIGATKIVVPSTDGELFPIASDPDGLQGLDPSLAICDEVGFVSIESFDSLLLASGKRPMSLVVGIGTPGLEREKNALWHVRKRVMDGTIIPGFHYTEFAAPEGCSVSDTTNWHKANPALAGGYKSIDAMHTALALSPESHFRIFHLGLWVDGVESWLGPDGRNVWESLTDPYDFIPGAPTWIGVDVALKKDSTAVVMVQQREDGRLHAKHKLWVPTAEQPVDTTDVMQYLREQDDKYDLKAVSFDPRFFDVPAKYLEDEGLPMIEIPQSVEHMTPAISHLYELIKNKNLSHDGEDAFTAHILNAIPRYNERGFTLAKAKSRGKIDATIALALAVDRAIRPTKQRAPLVIL